MIVNEEKGYFIQSLKKTFRFYNNNNSSYLSNVILTPHLKHSASK